MSTPPLSNYVDKIRAVYPDLMIDNATINHDGQNNIVLIVDNRMVFRFPRYQKGLTQLAREVRILKAIKPLVTLPVPDPQYSHLDAPAGDTFTGYRMLPGETINIYSLESRFDATPCERLAAQLADFLQALHRVPLITIQDDIAVIDRHDYWYTMYTQIQHHLFDKMRPDACRTIAQHFEDFLDSDDDFQQALIHGDFGTGNILFDHAKQEFCGVIDFGSSAIGDPALDLAAIYGFNGRGKTFFRRMMAHYPDLEAMLPRIQFYSGTFALQEALHGALNDDRDALIAGLEPYV